MPFRLKLIFGIVTIQAVLLTVLIWSGLNTLRNSNEAALIDRTLSTTKLFASSTQAAVLRGHCFSVTFH